MSMRRITPRPQLRLCSATSVSHTLLFRKYVRSYTRTYVAIFSTLPGRRVSDGVWTRGLEKQLSLEELMDKKVTIETEMLTHNTTLETV